MNVRLIEPVTLRSEPLMAGTQIDVDDITAQQLIDAGQATVDAPKTEKTQSPKE